MKKKTTKSAAAKKAMAERGTYKIEANSVYGKPYTGAVTTAVAPFNAMLKRAQQTWGQRLLECVPPAYAARYRQLVENLDEAMGAEDAKATADYAAQLCRALPLMHQAAIDAGHNPASSDVVTTVLDGTVYAFVVRGDLGLVRKQNPDWVVYVPYQTQRWPSEAVWRALCKKPPNISPTSRSAKARARSSGFSGFPLGNPTPYTLDIGETPKAQF